MSTVDLNLDGEGCWPDLAVLAERGHLVTLGDSTPWRLAVLPGGTSSGAPSLALRLDVPDLALPVPSLSEQLRDPDGEITEVHRPLTVVAETSLATWIAATAAIRGRYPQAFAGGPLERRD